MNPYQNNDEPRVKVAAQADTHTSSIVIIFVVLSLLVALLGLGQASAT